MDPNKAYQAVDSLIEGMNADEQSQLFEHLRTSYPEQLGPVAVNGAAAEQTEQASTLTLTPEQQEKASTLTTAMAEKFGVKEEDFSVLRTEAEDGSDVLTLAYTAENGIDLGDPKKDYDPKRSWDGIFDKKADKKFMITVDGKKVDTRAGMTRDVYNAFIDDAKARAVDPLPDSPQLSEQNGEVWTHTWLTGEEAVRGCALLAIVRRDGQVYSDRRLRDLGRRDLRFRPAVVIERCDPSRQRQPESSVPSRSGE